VREKYCSLAEKVWLISQANRAITKGRKIGSDYPDYGKIMKKHILF